MITLSSLAEIFGGGPGSGCHGPACGRPGSKKRTQYLLKKIQKKQPWQKTSHRKVPLGVTRKNGKEFIKVKPARNSQVIKKFSTPHGHDITVIKPPKQNDKTGMTWIKKVSPQKGQFSKLMEETAFNNNKEKTAFFAAPVEKDRNTAIQVVRNLGQLRTTVKEIDLIGDNHIARTRVIGFKNMGQASGFLSKRYGITFKFK